MRKQKEIGFLLMAEVRVYLSSQLHLGQCQWPKEASLTHKVDENHRRCQCHNEPAMGNPRPSAPGAMSELWEPNVVFPNP